MSKPAPGWDEILTAAEEELRAFSDAIPVFQARMGKLQIAMTKKLYDELRRELDDTDSAWDILVGVAITAASQHVAAQATRLVLSNILRGWAVMTTVRTAPIVVGSTSERYVSGIKAAQILAGVRRQSVMKELTTPGKPLYDVNKDVSDLLVSATSALIEHGMTSGSSETAAPQPAPASQQPTYGPHDDLSVEATELLKRMPLLDEQDRFTMALQAQHHKADVLLRNMRSTIAVIEQDPDLEATLRKEWRATDDALEKMAGQPRTSHVGSDPAPAVNYSNSRPRDGRIPPGTKGDDLEIHKRYLQALYANQWTNTVAFLQFGPAHKLGTIRPDAYKRENLTSPLTYPLGGRPRRLPPKEPFFPNVPYRATYPHWWSSNDRKTAAYFVEGEGYETEIVSLKNAAAAEAMIEVLADPDSGFEVSYLTHAAGMVSLPKGPGLTEFTQRGRLELQTREAAAKDQAFQRMFRDVDDTWLRLRVIPTAHALLSAIRRTAPAQFVSNWSIRDGLERTQDQHRQ